MNDLKELLLEFVPMIVAFSVMASFCALMLGLFVGIFIYIVNLFI